MSPSSYDWPTDARIRPYAGGAPERDTYKRSTFSASWSNTLGLLRREIRAIGGTDVVLEIDIQEAMLRNDGMPRANAVPFSPAVRLTLTTKGGALAFPCDTFDDWRDNLRAIALTMDALRAVARFGVAQHAQQYTGWKALESARPTGGVPEALNELAMLAYGAGYIDDGEPVSALLRRAQRMAHPDTGGTAAKWARLAAAEALLREAGEIS